MGEAKAKKKIVIEEISKGLDLTTVEISFLEGLVNVKKGLDKAQFSDYIGMFLTKVRVADLSEDFLDGIDRIKEMV